MAVLPKAIRHPLLQAARWEFRRASALQWIVAALLACAGGAGAGLTGYWSAIRPILVSHLLTLSVLLALQASFLARAGRHKWANHYASGWLHTIPASRRAFAGMVALRALLPPCLIFVLVALAVWVAERATRSADFAGVLFVDGMVATLGGGLLGWMLPRQSNSSSGVGGAPRVG